MTLTRGMTRFERDLLAEPANAREVVALSLSRDGRWGVSGTFGSGEVVVWDIAARRVHARLPTRARHLALCAVDPTGSWVAVDAGEGQVELFDLATPGPVTSFAACDQELNTLAFSPDGGLLLAGGLQWAGGAVFAALRLAMLDTRTREVLWSVQHPEEGAAILGFEMDPPAVGFAADGVGLLLGLQGRFERRHRGTGALIDRWRCFAGDVQAERSALAADEATAVLRWLGGTVERRALADGAVLGRVPCARCRGLLAATPDLRRVVVDERPWRLLVWDPPSDVRARIELGPCDGDISALCVAADGETLLVGTARGTVLRFVAQRSSKAKLV